MNSSQQITTFIILVLFIILGGWALLHYPKTGGTALDVSATSSTVGLPLPTTTGSMITESKPGIATTIHMTYPLVDARIDNPLVVTGEAKGVWFFEANAGMYLTDVDGNVLATGYIEAKTDWMTTDFVPFVGKLSFTKPGYGTRGYLHITNANPSGEPQNGWSIKIPVIF